MGFVSVRELLASKGRAAFSSLKSRLGNPGKTSKEQATLWKNTTDTSHRTCSAWQLPEVGFFHGSLPDFWLSSLLQKSLRSGAVRGRAGCAQAGRSGGGRPVRWPIVWTKWNDWSCLSQSCEGHRHRLFNFFQLYSLMALRISIDPTSNFGVRQISMHQASFS